jgi:hypothetical protein
MLTTHPQIKRHGQNSAELYILPPLWDFQNVTGYLLFDMEIILIPAGEENIPLISEALVLVPSGTQTDIVISHFVIWTSLSPLSYYNGFHRTQNQ